MKRCTGIVAPAVRVHAGAPAGIAALVAAAGLAMPAAAAPWHWNVVGGSWSNAANWAPAAVPVAASDVFIGSTAPAKNATVVLDLDRTIASLTITDGMTASNLVSASYVVEGDTVVSGKNVVPGAFGVLTEYPSRLLLEAVDGTTLWTHNLELSEGGRAVLDYAFVRVEGMTTIDAESRLQGHGYVDSLGNGVKVRNDGTIRSTHADVPLHFRQFDEGTYDLDGVSGDGVLDLRTVSDTQMEFEGTSLADSFSGTIEMGWDAHLTMALSDGWTADANSNINVETSNYGLAVIDGGAFSFGGHIAIGNGSGWLSLTPEDMTFLPTAMVDVATNNALEVGAGGTTSVSIEGGQFTLAEFGNVNFHAPTIVRGGVFQTSSSNPDYGSIDFFGPTEYDGTVTFHGSARQYGDARVTGPTTIHADTFDMSGGPATKWEIVDALKINADALASNGASGVPADIKIAGGFLSKMTVNLTEGPWLHFGELRLTGTPGFFVDRVAGSGLQFHGDLVLPSGKAGISADMVIAASASVNLASATSELRLTGDTWVQTAEFLGAGTLLNGSMGVMTLSNGLTMGSVGFVNQGEFEIGIGEGLISAGLASVDRFENAADAVWAISLGGHASGAEHDLLLVTGGETHLDGLMQVHLADLGGGTFLPSIGDEFLVLVSLGAISGTFAHDPVTHFNGVSYEWSVVYTPHTVSLRLDGIVPAPGAMALAGLAGLALIRRIGR